MKINKDKKFNICKSLLDQYTNQFIKNIDPHICAELGDTFEYFYESNFIHYTLISSERTDEIWRKFISKLGNYNCIGNRYDFFLFSLLHEVGHHMTNEYWSEEEQEKFDKKKDFTSNMLTYNIFNFRWIEDLADKIYFNIPDEREATLWAAEYIKTHIAECDAYWDKVKRVMSYLMNDSNEMERE